METSRVLSKPLGNTVARPLRTAVLWGMLAGLVAVLVAFGVAAVVFVVRWVAGLFGDAAAAWSWQLVADVGAVLAMLTLVSATWAASFGSTHLAPTGRAAVASALGVGVLALLVRFEWPAAALAAATVAWSVAIPFERWDRAAARTVVGVAATIASRLMLSDPSVWLIALIVAGSYPSAALGIGAGDAIWRLATRRSERDGGERDEAHE